MQAQLYGSGFREVRPTIVEQLAPRTGKSLPSFGVGKTVTWTVDDRVHAPSKNTLKSESSLSIIFNMGTMVEYRNAGSDATSVVIESVIFDDHAGVRREATLHIGGHIVWASAPDHDGDTIWGRGATKQESLSDLAATLAEVEETVAGDPSSEWFQLNQG